MLNGRRVRLMSATCAIISMGFTSMCVVGCVKTTSCKVSPVELEEMREDIANLQKDLKLAKDREAQLTADLAAKQADLETKRGKPPELRAELEQVKKGAGKTEKAKDAPKTPAPAKKPAAGDAPVNDTKAPAKAPAPPTTKPATPPSDTTKAPVPKPKPASTAPATPKKGNP